MCILSRYKSQRLYVHVSVYVHPYECMCSQKLMCICDCLGYIWRPEAEVYLCVTMFLCIWKPDIEVVCLL